MIEGEGIRVVDISEDAKISRSCIVQEEGDNFSQTAEALSGFFQCQLRKGKTEISDIILTLGEREKEWDIK